MADQHRFMSLLVPAFVKNISFAEDEPARIGAQFLDTLKGEESGALSEPFASLLTPVMNELEQAVDGSRGDAWHELSRYLTSGGTLAESPEQLWRLFFPEALFLDEDPQTQIEKLRERRRVGGLEVSGDPILNPAVEILFTSNALLTLPFDRAAEEQFDDGFRERLRAVAGETQAFWYDHPVFLGTRPEANEILYGLQGLSQAAGFEKGRGTMAADAELTVALSVSVTHTGLRSLAAEWLRTVFADETQKSLEGLAVYGFTEDDTAAIISLLEPFLDKPADKELLLEVFGVDGEYGRHYSFLKALPALLHVVGGGALKGTFKIDLDQVFPEQELVDETGRSALELLSNPYWGGRGWDSNGNPLELGMIAGALVNEKDIENGLFTPDIPWPEELPRGEELFFFKQRPMAVSTRAEMMTIYGQAGMPDGKREALQRVHVTGGTNGIRIDALRRHRAFTPTFIGRAEDQAYLLSTLTGGEKSRQLAYLHQPGLIMRHDKEAFAAGAVKAGKAGSYVGDLVRTLAFSDYASFLPGGQARVKSLADPFTGCFITDMPFTSIALRLALHLIDAEKGTLKERRGILELAARRLPAETVKSRGPEGELAARWERERQTWNIFYDLLDRLEASVPDSLHRSFGKLMERCRLV